MQLEKTVQRGPIVVGFDMDGVIIDHTANKIALAESYAVRLRPEETHPETLVQKFAHNEYMAFQEELYGNSDFALSAPLMEGAGEVLRALHDDGIPFVLISRRRNKNNAIALLVARGVWGELFTEQNSFFSLSASGKNAVGVREGVTHFFDDQPTVLLEMPDITNRYLVDTFRQFNDEKELPRVYDWSMVREVIFSQSA